MKNKTNLFNLVLGLVLLGLLGWLVYLIIKTISNALVSADSTVVVAAITVSGTILVSALGFALSRYYQHKHEQEIVHRDKKTDFYDETLKVFFDHFFKSADKRQTNEYPEELISFLREFQRKLILWANPETIRAYAEWNKELRTLPPRFETMIKMIDFFLALRRDLGHSNKGIGREHIARLFLRNPELAMREYERNPLITMAEITEIENRQQELDSK